MVAESPFQPPYATAKTQRVFGKIRLQAEDFRVDEVPAYAPTGHGEHLFVRFEKTGLTTPQAIAELARALGVDAARAGHAGLKDKHAVTTQWASFEGADAARAATLALPAIRVLEASPHPHKIRTGHLRANRFRIRIADAGAGAADTAGELLGELHASGVPNYYGEQRFGRDGGNVEAALRWLRDGGTPPRDRCQRKLLVSAWQSDLFNRWLADRLLRGELARAVPGDVMRKEDTGGVFVAEDAVEAQTRVESWAISPTGPMFGTRMRSAALDAGERERELWAARGIADAALAKLGKLAEGTRRVARIRPADVEVQSAGEDLLLAFTLPKGAYATVVLRELQKPDV
jgi:tRNA pseudouridine13 synthase